MYVYVCGVCIFVYFIYAHVGCVCVIVHVCVVCMCVCFWDMCVCDCMYMCGMYMCVRVGYVNPRNQLFITLKICEKSRQEGLAQNWVFLGVVH